MQLLFQTPDVKLTEVQEKIQNVPLDNNVLILSDCGSGKTEAAYYQAMRWGDRIIYVQPQRTLATATYKRLNRYNQILGLDPWTIQHSSMPEDVFLSNTSVVSSIDQVLGGYLGIGIQAYAKGRNVVRSNFIFDEIQLFEPGKTLMTTVCMLDALHTRGNKFIIMTATMPEYLINFLKVRYNMEVIITEKPAVKKKTKLFYIHDINFKRVNEYPQKQIIICNTQREQIEIRDKIKDQSRLVLLNNKLVTPDRSEAENEVFLYFGKDSKPNNKILISTQVIEAGMDISAHRVYSSLSSIDSLIQRDGRNSRWGGVGEIFVFKGFFYGIYDEKVVECTLKKLIQFPGIVFTWDIQKKWSNEILNPYYEAILNEDNIRDFKYELKSGDRNTLIREINAVNIIVDNVPSVESFSRYSISVSMKSLKKIAECNVLYRLKKRLMEAVDYKSVQIGETLVITGQFTRYDKAGFRYEELRVCDTFPFDPDKKKRTYPDYNKESWLHHCQTVRAIFLQKLLREQFSDYVKKNVFYIAMIGGLHDIGKLDELWQGKFWANAIHEPLAHFPFRGGNPALFHERNHAVISGKLLEPYVDKILLNMIIQHHKRTFVPDGEQLNLKKYELDKRYSRYLKEYGFDKAVTEEGKGLAFDTSDILNPKDKDWVEFVYLAGTLIESDIEAVQKYATKTTP